ncbi:hypothetical protein BH10PSE2_BH10PSE2_21100 [soil metagenome]
MASSKRAIVIQTLSGVAAVLCGALIAGIAVGYLDASRAASSGPSASDNPLTLWVFVAFAAMVMVGAIVVSAKWMRLIDEAAREAHKAAWFWGGSAGMAVGGVGVILTALPQSAFLAIPALMGRTDPVIYLAAGASAMLLLMLVGYGIVWAWWWLVRR